MARSVCDLVFRIHTCCKVVIEPVTLGFVLEIRDANFEKKKTSCYVPMTSFLLLFTVTAWPFNYRRIWIESGYEGSPLNSPKDLEQEDFWEDFPDNFRREGRRSLLRVN